MHSHRHDSFGLQASAARDEFMPSHSLHLPVATSSRRGWLTAAGAMLAFLSNSAHAADVLSDEYVLVVDEGPIGIELIDLSRCGCSVLMK
jgi:hypothetical protein